MMDFEDNSFDVTIDKGTLDALMVYFYFISSARKTMKFPEI